MTDTAVLNPANRLSQLGELRLEDFANAGGAPNPGQEDQ